MSINHIPYHLRQPHELKSEKDHQRALFSWLRTHQVQEQHPALSWVFAVPNGGHRGAGSGASMLLEGCKPGVPDILLLYPSHGMYGLAIELKTPTGKISQEQHAFIARHITLGYECRVCRSWTEARDVLVDWVS